MNIPPRVGGRATVLIDTTEQGGDCGKGGDPYPQVTDPNPRILGGTLSDRLNGLSARRIGQLLFDFCWPGNRNAEPADKSVLINVRIKRPHLSPGATQ